VRSKKSCGYSVSYLQNWTSPLPQLFFKILIATFWAASFFLVWNSAWHLVDPDLIPSGDFHVRCTGSKVPQLFFCTTAIECEVRRYSCRKSWDLKLLTTEINRDCGYAAVQLWIKNVRKSCKYEVAEYWLRAYKKIYMSAHFCSVLLHATDPTQPKVLLTVMKFVKKTKIYHHSATARYTYGSTDLQSFES
jgi:hypothetical protein